MHVFNGRRLGATNKVPDSTREISLESLASLGRTVGLCRHLHPVPVVTDAEPGCPMPMHWKITTDPDGAA